MKHSSYALIVGFGLLSLITQDCLAKSWPIFAPPDKQLLLDLKLIDTSQCPNDQGRLLNTPVNISQFLCKNNCPSYWAWETNNISQCHHLSDFNFKGFNISHHNNGYEVGYSVITAEYGPINSDKIIFEYTLTTALDEYWYCVLVDKKSGLFSCAADR